MRTQNLLTRRESYEKGFLTLIGSHTRNTYEILDHLSIGRDLAMQVVLNDACVSMRHARIEQRQDSFYLRDLRSRNGTFLNGTPIVEARLQANDRIQIGTTEFLFSSEKNSDLKSALLASQNPAWDQQLRRLPAIAQSPHPILLLGPSGSGKEVLANAVHRLSTRARHAFLSVNCSALTESLAESELFGHVKGAFTGALEDRKGAFEAARGGTLFLDEIGDLPMSLQPKFLRALENQEIKPVGSDKTSPIDVRIVAATNRDLRQLVEQGRFREDLYYRLHIIQLRPPALNERLEDFDTLLQSFASPLRVRFTVEALSRLKAYRWPGNIREMKNVVSRAAALFPNQPISENEIDDVLDRPREDVEAEQKKDPGLTPFPSRQTFKEYEKEAILERLIYYRGNQRQVAADLGMPKSTLNDRLRRYNIDAKKIKGS